MGEKKVFKTSSTAGTPTLKTHVGLLFGFRSSGQTPLRGRLFCGPVWEVGPVRYNNSNNDENANNKNHNNHDNRK